MLKITLAAARVNKGMKQCEAAKALGIMPSTLRNWEKGKTFPKASYLAKLCDLYGVSTDHIFFG
jgi:transcriptional regulator with XRE-family HTH domain